jgi:hypothetical protein
MVRGMRKRNDEIIEDLNRFLVDYKPDHTDIEWQANVLERECLTDGDLGFDEWNLHLDELSEEDIDLDNLTGGKWIYSTPLLPPTKDPTQTSITARNQTTAYLRIMFAEINMKMRDFIRDVRPKNSTRHASYHVPCHNAETGRQGRMDDPVPRVGDLNLDDLAEGGHKENVDPLARPITVLNSLKPVKDLGVMPIDENNPTIPKHEQGIFHNNLPDGSLGFNDGGGDKYPNQRATQQLRDVDGVMKNHDITGWLKNRRGATSTTVLEVGEQPAGHGNGDSVMMIHDITGWMKSWVESTLSTKVGMGKSSGVTGVMKLHDLTGWLKMAVPNNNCEEGVRWNLLRMHKFIWYVFGTRGS